ncbi:Scr1 family TA system antitoxin-like transcriptional regulator [Streptomyces sp. NPDC021225]|uniref:Scr1 family TA system antitoxin-like transcriptional regulator n=1 Tax=Streptomyces sp. NPDC021225 TaxID=3365121 RepID=UPI0037AA76E5
MIRIPSASKLWAVINEAAIRHHVCSTEVVRQQLERLAHASEYPRITIQFLPFAAGAHAGLYGSFMVMDFPTPTPEVVWSENLTPSTLWTRRMWTGTSRFSTNYGTARLGFSSIAKELQNEEH